MVAYVVRNNKLVKVFLPPDLPKEHFSREDEKKQIASQLSEIDAFARKKKIILSENPKLLTRLAEDLKAFFSGKPANFKHELDLDSLTMFTQKVLRAAISIPYGKTVSYSDLAKKIGRPRAFRAVARALAGNPIPLVIPCHRIVYRDGSIGGFSAPSGPAFKIKLFDLEGGKKSI